MSTHEQINFLLACIKHNSNGAKIDFEAVAAELNIPTKAAAAKRYERLKKRAQSSDFADLTASAAAAASSADSSSIEVAGAPKNPKTPRTPRTPKAPKAAARAAAKAAPQTPQATIVAPPITPEGTPASSSSGSGSGSGSGSESAKRKRLPGLSFDEALGMAFTPVNGPCTNDSKRSKTGTEHDDAAGSEDGAAAAAAAIGKPDRDAGGTESWLAVMLAGAEEGTAAKDGM